MNSNRNIIEQNSILEFLSGVSSIIVPDFHRSYCWSKAEIKLLMQDIINLSHASEKTTHFLGVLTLQKTQNSSEVILVDGVQRLITISLLLAAINKIYNGTSIGNDVSVKKIQARFLINIKTELPKIKLNGLQREAYFSVINNAEDAFAQDFEAFNSILNFFVEQIQPEKIDINNLFNAISKLKVFEIYLSSQTNCIENVYQGLNSSNLKLSKLDEIRNFVYMQMKIAGMTHLYTNYFLAAEENYRAIGRYNLFESFITDYLTIQQNARIPEPESLFMSFKDFFLNASKIQSHEQIIMHLYRYSSYYLKIATAGIIDVDVRSQIEKINSKNATDAYPYLMEVFEDYEFGNINKSMLLDILNTINIFIEERESDNPSAFAMNFAGLSAEINKMLALKDYAPQIVTDDYLDSHITINDIMNN